MDNQSSLRSIENNVRGNYLYDFEISGFES